MILTGRQQIELRRVPLALPGPEEILVRVDAATTCGTDVKVYRLGGHPRMLQVPSPFGHEMAGTVVATGDQVESWRVGDLVVVVNSASCGRCRYCQKDRENLCPDLRYLNGAFAEYLLVPPRFVARSTYRRPTGLPAEQATLTEPLACVLHGIEVCRLGESADVLVLGAGAIGQLMVGALAADRHRVTVIDSNENRRATAKEMGARATQDRQKSAGLDGTFDLAVDATGTLGGWDQAVRSVRPGGQVLFFGGCPPGSRLELDTTRVHYGELTLRGAYHHRPSTVSRALELLSRERFPAHLVLTSRLPLARTAEALQRMISRQDLKVVLQP